MDMLNLVVLLLLSFASIMASNSHRPEVREDVKESASEVVRSIQIPENIQQHCFSPPIFDYGKATQPDLQKWRYFQQQQVDSRNLAKVKEHMDPTGLFKKGFHYRTQLVYAPEKINLEDNLQPRWKIVHPKFVTEKQRDVSPSEVANVEFGRRENKKVHVVPKPFNRNEKESNRKEDIVKELDLEVEASENHERIEENGFVNQILPGSYNQVNDITALNSLLGQTPAAQLEGLQQLLHSQSTNVAPVAQQNVELSTLLQNGHNLPQGLLQRNNILAKPQQIDHLQAQLDALAQNHAQKAIEEAHQKAFEHIQSQHKAIELAKIQAEKQAFAQIEAQNYAIVESGVQSIPISSELPNEKDVRSGSSNLVHGQTHHIAVKTQPVAEALTRNQVNHQAAINHAVLQAQAYLQLSAQTPTPVAAEKFPNNFQAEYTNTDHESINQVSKEPNHFQQQEQVYANIGEGYANRQQLEGNDAHQVLNVEESVPLEEHNDEYAPQYKFGYRIMDYHSGNDYGHEEVREGKTTNGQYHTLLPDGRVQNVVYWADPTGYHAKVTYSGSAQH